MSVAIFIKYRHYAESSTASLQDLNYYSSDVAACHGTSSIRTVYHEKSARALEQDPEGPSVEDVYQLDSLHNENQNVDVPLPTNICSNKSPSD